MGCFLASGHWPIRSFVYKLAYEFHNELSNFTMNFGKKGSEHFSEIDNNTQSNQLFLV